MERRFEQVVKVKIPFFLSRREKQRYIKPLLVKLDQHFNHHVLDRGDWPLSVGVIEEERSEVLEVQFVKILEPNETTELFRSRVALFIRDQLGLDIVE